VLIIDDIAKIDSNKNKEPSTIGFSLIFGYLDSYRLTDNSHNML
jgi:hypothetical protein